MKRLCSALIFCLPVLVQAQKQSVFSPNKKIELQFELVDKKPVYQVLYNKVPVLQPSALGLETATETFAENCILKKSNASVAVKDAYAILNAKKRKVAYAANRRVFTLQNAAGHLMDIVFQVSDDGVAFRYTFPASKDISIKINKEFTAYHFTRETKAWLQPMSASKSGWEKTNPAYEEHYKQNIAVEAAATGAGWVYPALFKSGDTWMLITEADMDGSYCATRLVNDSGSTVYQVGFPDPREVINITGGGLAPQLQAPARSPWRIITIGGLNTIVESTLGTDLAQPSIALPDAAFVKPGKAAWSWIMSKDDSIVFNEQKRYIDLAADMNWPYTLVDADWDRKIGYDKIAELAQYAAGKNVGLLLWYNSAGDWNTVKYTPKNLLLNTDLRAKEFARLQAMGIKGVKIDFFGGDGQSVMQYYVDILKDAAKYKLLVNFHGATLPRGWARTYPHLMTTEAVRGFEMITFNQADADLEATHCTMLPFTRNAFDPMDFTPMNLYKIPTRVKRKTTSTFELATSVLFLSGIQHYAESPASMARVPEFVKDFLRTLPNNWDDVKFIDGYPGKYVVIARRTGNKWYIAGINGENAARTCDLDLKFLSGKGLHIIEDGGQPFSFNQANKIVEKDGKFRMMLQPNGGFVAVTK